MSQTCCSEKQGWSEKWSVTPRETTAETAHDTQFTVPHLTAGIISNITHTVSLRATKASPSGSLQTVSFVTHKNRKDIANTILAKSSWSGLSKGSPRSYLPFPTWSCLAMTVTDLRMACNTELWGIKINVTHFAKHFIFTTKKTCTVNKVITTIKMTTVKEKAPFENACSCGKPPLGGITGIPTVAAIWVICNFWKAT